MAESSSMFSGPTPERGFPTTAVSIAAVAIVILVSFFILMSHRKPAPATSNAAYIANLQISNIQMSESDTATGGKQTYIDGHIANHGSLTVTGATIQTAFGNDQSMPPQIEAGQLRVVYMRDPYLDTRPVTAASPLKPGEEADFRLIFEDVPENWNQQLPELRLTQITTR
jgi:hypothetical protein